MRIIILLTLVMAYLPCVTQDVLSPPEYFRAVWSKVMFYDSDVHGINEDGSLTDPSKAVFPDNPQPVLSIGASGLKVVVNGETETVPFARLRVTTNDDDYITEFVMVLGNGSVIQTMCRVENKGQLANTWILQSFYWDEETEAMKEDFRYALVKE